MESVVVLFAGTLLLLAVASPIVAFLALIRVSRIERRLDEMSRRLGQPEPRPAPAVSSEAAGGAPPRREARSAPDPDPVRAPSPPPVEAAAEGPPPRWEPPPPSKPPPPSWDFATNLGPRILVGAGGLAVVVFLALFVRYAWENDWVGPTGRVLSGAVWSLGLVAAGLRLLGGRYRPLGQGLAAAGFAGLYVTAFAAHSVYALVPRGLSAIVMVAATVCAVAVADRLNTRLLAALAWVGGYLTPILLSTGEDRAISLFAYLLALGAGAAWLDRRKPWPETLPLALVGTVLLYAGWGAEHYRPERFEVAAAGLISLSALFTVTVARRGRVGGFASVLLAAILVTGGVASIVLAHSTDRPIALLFLLAAQAGLTVFGRRRWAWAESTGVTLGGLAVLAWFSESFRPERAPEALTLGLGLAGVFVVALATRGLIFRVPLRVPDGTTQVLAAGLAWLIVDNVLDVTAPSLLGPAAVALAAIHLALGLAARGQGSPQGLWARVALALAAVFLTLAIPVQLGLYGITLAWAGEALVLLWLGLRHDSWRTRAGAYGVLLLAVGRLLARHFPLHDGAFTPVLNPAFGTWLLVIAAVVVAWRMAAPARERGSALDVWVGHLLSPLGLALLFGLLTAETASLFDQRARVARAAGRPEVALAAQRQAGLALSVLWTVFATALLASGLALRSRGLFYAAYGLFGVTALKVVMIDLATMPTLYRMLSFLALGVLLLAGAWLNLRFRERLVAPGGEA